MLKEVRDARNVSVGHPTKVTRKGEVSAHGIIRLSLGKEDFELASFSEKDGLSIHGVHLCDLIEKQRVEMLRILSSVVDELKREDTEHKAKFREEKLSRCFSQVLYALEKIREELRDRGPVRLGSWGVGELRRSLAEFDLALRERGMEISTYDSISYLYDTISYPLAELGKFFNGEASEISSSRAALVYADALRGHFSELMHSADEIDEEYSDGPDQSLSGES